MRQCDVGKGSGDDWGWLAGPIPIFNESCPDSCIKTVAFWALVGFGEFCFFEKFEN